MFGYFTEKTLLVAMRLSVFRVVSDKTAQASEGYCHVWMAPFMQGFFSTDVDRYGERSCVRPFDAVDVTAGLDEVRVPGP